METRLSWNVKRAILIAIAAVLCLPLVRLALDEWTPKPEVDWNGKAWNARKGLVARAHVFVSPLPAIPSLDLSRPPADPNPLDPAAPLECRFVPKPLTGTTPKFDCRLATGEVIKVKYGRTPERLGEVAATRLLAALGFGADHMSLVPKVTCVGCPPFPFQMRRVADAFFAAPLLELVTFRNQTWEFTWPSIERKMPGRAIEVPPHAGWDWNELPSIEPANGGATRAELDALRLIAMFLSHWDNKAINHRVVCEDGAGGTDPSAPCQAPLLMLQDVGATFGPTKVQHAEWAAMPIWADAGTCVVSFEKLPYHGGNFTPIQISEGGRALIADRLRQLSEAQIRTLFQSARFPDPATGVENGDVTMWVRAFQDKVRQIADRPACPPLPK